MNINRLRNTLLFILLQMIFSQIAVGAGVSSDPTIGGGKLYAEVGNNNSIIGGEFTVVNLDELKLALNNACPNQTIFIPGNIEINLTNEALPLLIPQGVTIASDRGINGSKGALLYSTSFKTYALLKVTADNVRITGFRLRGPHSYIQSSYEDLGIISQNSNNLVIDNMELFNWGFSAVNLSGRTSNAQVHHSSIHHNQRQGLGYGVVLYGESKAIIHHNLFDSNRHSIAGSGEPGQGYEAHSNIILANSNGHAFDMHGYYEWAGPKDSEIAGEYVNIHDNTFLVANNAIVIRGVPTAGVVIKNNKFSNYNENEAIRQNVLGVNVEHLLYQGNFSVLDNEYNQAGDMLYADLEEGEGAMQKIPNDIFWAAPESTASVSGRITKKWYVSHDATEPWKRLLSSKLTLEQLRVKDFDADGVADVFNASRGQWNISSSGKKSWQLWNNSESLISDLLFGDINGDGVTDVIHKQWGSVSWNGSCRWHWNVLHNSIDFNQILFNIDVGNDRQTDIVRAIGNSFEVSWGGQTAFESIGNHTFIHSGYGHGDFDGDGKKDIFRISGNNWEVCYYGDDYFQLLSNNHDESLSDIALGDFNGDGKTDIFRKNDNQWQYSSGGIDAWENLQCSNLPLSNLAFGDFNGDGFTDVFYKNSNNTWKVSWSGASRWATINNSGVEFSRLIFSDFNGDGRTDVAHSTNGVVKVSLAGTSFWKIWPQLDIRPPSELRVYRQLRENRKKQSLQNEKSTTKNSLYAF